MYDLYDMYDLYYLDRALSEVPKYSSNFLVAEARYSLSPSRTKHNSDR